MNHDELMELILEHYKHPKNRGRIENASVVQKGGNPGCGDIITVYLDADEDGVVNRLSFEGEGCMVSQAGTSIILERARGMTLSEIEEMDPGTVTEILGKRLVTTRPACTHLGLNTLKLAVKKLKAEQDSLKRGEVHGN
ncbi:MAG TPA: iron-sulfur cluster assembly scaffold protein [Thermodesulfobacteriota bacterium]|nr:iron-sulfur cluster assembly scaffold protein [Thermodesulfobacteriota bacterium]